MQKIKKFYREVNYVHLALNGNENSDCRNLSVHLLRNSLMTPFCIVRIFPFYCGVELFSSSAWRIEVWFFCFVLIPGPSCSKHR